MSKKNEVREFLISRRANVTPEQAGLPDTGGERRVPGLRREEVAMLAGLSTDYYTRLERGKIRGASESVLNAIARALQLDDVERDLPAGPGQLNGSPRLKPGDLQLRTHGNRDPKRGGSSVSYTVNTGLAPFCQSEDRPRGVPVPVRGIPAVSAPEDSFGEPEPLLGSREAARTRHGGVGGRDDHHLSSGPHGTLDQLSSGGAQGDVRCFAGHPRAGQELQPQVLHGDQLVVVDHLFCPDPRGVLGLTGGAFLDPRFRSACLPVAPRGRLPFARLRRAIFRCALASSAAHRRRCPA
jgi:Helix-turn-helix domain